MNREMGKMSRLINMIFFIQARPGVSVSTLVERYGIDERTVYRDLGCIERARVPIYYDHGYRILSGWQHIFTFEGREIDVTLSNEIYL